ncbi:response regulator transcription factor [Arenicella sp. 4NH20-0111]
MTVRDKIKSRLLVVEDDESLRLTLIDNLEMEGFEVFGASTVAEATGIISTQSNANEIIDLMILDIMLPDGSGYALCESIRLNDQHMMILMLTARTLDSDLQEGFNAGADDYLTKPYKVAELLLRVNALLRRQVNKEPMNLKSLINDFEINWQQRQVINQHQVIHFTKKEFDLLKLLYDNIDQPLSRDQILSSVWGTEVYVEERTVDNFISNIRKMLNLNPPHPYVIRTVRGIGYALMRNNG